MGAADVDKNNELVRKLILFDYPTPAGLLFAAQNWTNNGYISVYFYSSAADVTAAAQQNQKDGGRRSAESATTATTVRNPIDYSLYKYIDPTNLPEVDCQIREGGRDYDGGVGDDKQQQQQQQSHQPE